ncbi:cyclin-B1-2-like [Pyrus ussuriensis x Pyrus communis]|uniref:Cyclin-B1-2-like n=1 Tax=Pyrus ussuriensis x Pyrus communis TaxID=2448454 RepID=A0A5N5FFE8_9ROSA|nr:cyclin-B1-2-like [Pyrus ussuriensis x Pyrus communis]
MEAPKTMEHKIGGIQKDALRFELQGVKSDLVGAHPLESALESAKLTQEQINRKILGYTYGSAFPLKMDSLLDSRGLPNQFLLLGLEVMTRRLDNFGFEDYLNDPPGI